jgi:hypothetical protein
MNKEVYDWEVYNWRKKHPKCIYCKYYRARRVGIEEVIIEECAAKDKMITFNSIPRWFCKIYTVKEP